MSLREVRWAAFRVAAALNPRGGVKFLYPGSAFSWTYNSAITSASPIYKGFAMPASNGFTVNSGTLPTGISLNADTGALTGTPTQEQYAQTAVIRATDTASVTHDTTITFTVARAPSISYAGSPFTWTLDVAISTANVTSNGGTVTSYAVQSGSLPTGISLNSSTGALTGTPTVESSGSATIRATGPGGTGDATVNWTVANVPDPPNISYADSPSNRPRGLPSVDWQVTNTGGACTDYSITSGALPSGATLNATTGAVTGIVSSIGTGSFVVQATNAGGSDTFEFFWEFTP